MVQSRLFWKLFLLSAALNVVATLILGSTTVSSQRQKIKQHAVDQLRRTAIASRVDLVKTLTANDRDKMRSYVANSAGSTGFQWLVLDPAGELVAQAPDGAAQIFASGPNVEPPPRTGDFVVSQPLVADGQLLATLYVGADRADIEKQLRRSDLRVWAVTGFIGLLVLSVCYAAARHVVQPIAALQQAADAIAVGDYRQRIYLPHRDEIGSLARSFNRMSQELDSRMTQLRQSGQRQATVLGGMIEGVIAVDDRERVLFANRAAGRLFDFSPPAIEGRRLLEVVRVHALHEAVSAALANRRPQRMEAIVEAGDKLSIAIQATPLPGDPCPGAVLVLHDVTELRRLERVRQEFVANVSHELKTPLSSIKAYAETLQNGALNDRETSHRFVSQIEEQAERLHSLILDMLTLARIESDQQAFEIVPVAVGDVVTACLGAYQAAADTKHLHLSAEIDDADLRVQADREGLREILDNLVDNAIKYTPEQGRVTVRCRADGEFATIAVEDTGIGIAADELARVFERFYRVDKARSREMGGTGLGLSIVKHLAQSFEGEVGVESKKGQGTTFTVMLPLA